MLTALYSAAVSLVGQSLLAAVPEPDNIVYGRITVANVPIPALRRDVTVEARRLINGPVVARYRMGSSAKLGDFYSLRIPLESAPGNESAATAGTGLFIVVLDESGILLQTGYTVGSRAAVQRLDLGTLPAGDDDGLPDAWEELVFGGLGEGPDSVNANGQTTLQNYIAGTNPHSTNSVFGLAVSDVGGLKTVSFNALRATGVGYSGLTRRYAIEYSTNLGGGIWLGLNGFTEVLGNDQVVVHQSLQTNSPVFYRGKVWLAAP